MSENGGRSFRELSAFRQLPEYHKWTFPPPPHTAHIRCITLDARVPDEILVGIEEAAWRAAEIEEKVGRISAAHPARPPIRSTTTRRHSPYQMGKHEDGRVYRDVHLVIRHPTQLDTLYATTGIGTYITTDNGRYWSKAEYGMGRAYAIPTVIHPDAPNRIFLGAAENGPTSWKGYRTVRAGPYNTIRFSRDTRRPAGLIHKFCAATMAARAGVASMAVCQRAILT